MKDSLTFDELRKANAERMGKIHPKCLDWNEDKWIKALMGELGEFCGWSKKYDRGDISLEEFLEEGTKELADVMTYLDLLANHYGIDLGEATRAKFNEVSDRFNCEIKL